MTPLLLGMSGLVAGVVGALLGVGGGVILVPLLTIVFGVPLLTAVATSLACVIASSSGASGVYVQDRLCDVRLGMLLEVATVLGALAGSVVATRVPHDALRLGLALVLTYVATTLVVHTGRRETAEDYEVRNLPLGLAVSTLAGGLSGALGIGGGPLKVPTMHLGMGVPFKIATATSNFMIGVTAAGSVFVYYQRGHIDLAVATPTVIGVYAGARLAARHLPRVESVWLQRAFALLLAVGAIEMALSATHLAQGYLR